MGSPRLRRLVAACLATLAAGAQAQEGDWQSFVSVTPIYEGKGDLDGGGDYSSYRAIVRVGFSTGIGGGNRAGLTLNYDYYDDNFSNPAAFGGVAPWGIVQRYGVSVPLLFPLPDQWLVGVTPSVDWFRENGADSSESMEWGALISATRWFSNGNRIGFGVAVFDRLEKTSVFPLLVVDWKLGERWRLVNPLPAGPTGPAGLELDYRFDGGWNVGVGAAYRSIRFRLSEDGPVPNGIGEERGLPVFLRATFNFDPRMSLRLYAGVITSGELRVEDPSGNTLREVDLGTTPIYGATFVARF